MRKKKKFILILVMVLVLMSYLYQSYALSSIITDSNDTYVVNVNNNSSIEVPANGFKTIYYKVLNTNKGTVKYGIGYSGTSVKVKVYNDSQDEETGLIEYGKSKFVKLKLINNNATSSTIKLSTILGYENGGNLIVPSGYTLVTEKINENNVMKSSEDATSASVAFLRSSLVRSSINSITFTNDNIVSTDVVGSMDISQNSDGGVMMWWYNSSTSGKYDVYIGSESGKVVIKDCYKLFSWLTSLTSLDLTYLDTSSVTNMSYMFFNTSSINELNLSGIDTSKVTNMKAMFSGCIALTKLNVSSFNTVNVTSMVDMFANCQNITEIDLSNFKTPNVTDISGMFYQNYLLENIDISNFDTSRVTNMSNLFCSCKKLTSLNLSNFNTSNVTNFYYMFNECNALTSVYLNSFDTSSATNMVGMFRKCSALRKIDLSSFDTSKVTSSYYMFLNCTAATEIDIRKADFSSVTNYNLMFSGVPNGTKIYVKNDTVKSWITSKFSNLTGVTTV